MKNFFLLILISVFPFVGYTQSLHRIQYGGAPRIRTSSFGLWYVLSNLENSFLDDLGVREMDNYDYADFYKKYSWMIPENTVAINVPNSIEQFGSTVKTQAPLWWRELLYGDYSHNFNISLGYELSWKSMISPFGGYVAVNWEYKQMAVSSEGFLFGRHHSQYLVPEFGFRFRLLGSGFDKDIYYNPTLEVGTAYVYPFKYQGPNDYEVEALGKGFRAHGAIGVELPSLHSTWLLQYDYDLFNYFDQDFTPDNGHTYPFKDVKSNYGTLSIKVSHSF